MCIDQDATPEYFVPADDTDESPYDAAIAGAQLYVRCRACGHYVGCLDAERSDHVRPVAWLRPCRHVSLARHLTPSLLFDQVLELDAAGTVSIEVQGVLA